MVNKYCAYGLCKNDSKRPNKLSKKGVWFISFPKPFSQPEKCHTWVRACGRADFKVEDVNRHTYICSVHFVGENGPTPAHPNPIPAVSTELEVELFIRRRKRKTAAGDQGKENVTPEKQACVMNNRIDTPHDLLQTIPAGESECMYTAERIQDENSEVVNTPEVLNIVEVATDDTLTDGEEGASTIDGEDHSYCRDSAGTSGIYVGIGTTTSDLITSSDKTTQIDLKVLKRQMFVADVEKSPKFYTGQTLELLQLLFGMLKEKAGRMKYWEGASTTGQDDHEDIAGSKRGPTRELNLYEEFLLTLVRLRRGLDIEVLADMLSVSTSSVSRIFITWTLFMRRELSFLVQWPSAEQVRENLPKAFKYFPKTRVIIDCTEFFVQKPSLPSSQRVTWSNYKHHNTFKLLVGITPSGSFSFVSHLWTGSVSDKKIVQESGFLDKIEYGDEVMADRGFLISDSLALRGATLTIPPFAHGRQLSSRAVTKTRRIANARIHVERAIGEMKNYKILQGVLSLKLKPLLDDIVFVCCALCNLGSRLVK